MNERIKELESTCWEELGEDEGYYPVFNIEKFAELIIQDCIKQIEQARCHFNTQPQYTDEQNKLVDEGFTWGIESCLVKVNHHFGTEE